MYGNEFNILIEELSEQENEETIKGQYQNFRHLLIVWHRLKIAHSSIYFSVISSETADELLQKAHKSLAKGIQIMEVRNDICDEEQKSYDCEFYYAEI